MKTTLLASLFTLALASQAQAACWTITHPYSGAIPAGATVTAYGPVTITNGPTCRSVVITSRIQSAQGGSAPKMWIERLQGGRWEILAEAPGSYIAKVTTAGTFRVQHKNGLNVPRVYTGSTAISR